MQPSVQSARPRRARWPWNIAIAMTVVAAISSYFVIYLANRTGNAEYELDHCEAELHWQVDRILNGELIPAPEAPKKARRH